jgi:hypothetical protein
MIVASRPSPRQSHESRKPPEQDQLTEERLTALEGVTPGVGAGVAVILVLATCIGAGSGPGSTLSLMSAIFCLFWVIAHLLKRTQPSMRPISGRLPGSLCPPTVAC